MLSASTKVTAAIFYHNKHWKLIFLFVLALIARRGRRNFCNRNKIALIARKSSQNQKLSPFPLPFPELTVQGVTMADDEQVRFSGPEASLLTFSSLL